MGDAFKCKDCGTVVETLQSCPSCGETAMRPIQSSEDTDVVANIVESGTAEADATAESGETEASESEESTEMEASDSDESSNEAASDTEPVATTDPDTTSGRRKRRSRPSTRACWPRCGRI